MDVVPDWVKVASITEFKQHCAQHCETDAEIKHFIELRRKIKNRVSGKKIRQFEKHFYSINHPLLGSCKKISGI